MYSFLVIVTLPFIDKILVQKESCSFLFLVMFVWRDQQKFHTFIIPYLNLTCYAPLNIMARSFSWA